MDKNTKLTFKKKLDVTDLAGEKVMIDFESGKYFMIRGVGNDIWDLLANPVSPAEIIERLLSEYDVEKEVCEKEVMDFLDKLKKLEFI